MNKTVIKVKWIDSTLKQIEIEIRDGKEPSRIVYPRQEDIEEAQYEYVRGEFFYRILNKFEELYGKHGILSCYGILKNNSDILKELICWPRNHQVMEDKNISVDHIPDEAHQILFGNIRKMALGWKVSSDMEIDVEHMASVFAKFEVDNYIWLFNCSADSKSLLNINKDAIELEWYEFNHDDKSFQKKFAGLIDGVSGIDNDQAIQWMNIIKGRVPLFEDIKKEYETKEIKGV